MCIHQTNQEEGEKNKDLDYVSWVITLVDVWFSWHHIVCQLKSSLHTTTLSGANVVPTT